MPPWLRSRSKYFATLPPAVFLAVYGRPPPSPPCSRPESGSSDVTLSSPSTSSAPLRSSLAPSAKASGARFVGSGQPRPELARRPGMSVAGCWCHRILHCAAETHAAAGTTAAAVVVRIANF